ncbi:hypothetical protein Bpfe_020904, partial [Biomphalaria pfeifferi]
MTVSTTGALTPQILYFTRSGALSIASISASRLLLPARAHQLVTFWIARKSSHYNIPSSHNSIEHLRKASSQTVVMYEKMISLAALKSRVGSLCLFSSWSSRFFIIVGMLRTERSTLQLDSSLA